MAASQGPSSNPTSYNKDSYSPLSLEQAQDQEADFTTSPSFYTDLLGTRKDYPVVYDLKISTYDSAIFALCFMEDSSIRETEGAWVYFQFIFAAVLHFSVIVAQFLLVLLLYATVVEESERPYEHGLHAFTGRLQNAVAENSIIDRDQDVMKLCRKDHTLAGSHIVVVVIWSCRMLTELRSALSVASIVMSMPTGAESITEQVVKDEHGEVASESYLIERMTMTLKVVIIIFVCGVHMLVTAFLTFTTSKYLILTGNMANVILKTISMQFIVTLDRLCLNAFGPPAYLKKIKASKLTYHGKRPTLLMQWSRSTFYATAVIMMALFLNRVIFSNINDFRTACRNYYIVFPNERNIPVDSFMAFKEAFSEALAFGLRRSEKALNGP